MASFTQAPAHFATRRRNVHPTAIGLKPPPFLFKAIRVAPKKEARAGTAVSPLSTQFTKKVTDRSNNCPPPRADLLIMSFRCCGRRASGPPAEPQGKEQMALATSSSDTWTGIGRSSVDTSGIAESGWGRGCFSRRVASVSLLGTAILSSENLLPLV